MLKFRIEVFFKVTKTISKRILNLNNMKKYYINCRI
jgi:hypothetical protein